MLKICRSRLTSLNVLLPRFRGGDVGVLKTMVDEGFLGKEFVFGARCKCGFKIEMRSCRLGMNHQCCLRCLHS